MLGGVCGGAAQYLNMDPTLVRVLTVLISLFTGVPIVLYLVALFVVPEEGKSPPPPAVPPYAHPDPMWGPTGAPWEQPQPAPPATGAGPAPSPESGHLPGDSTEPGDSREPR